MLRSYQYSENDPINERIQNPSFRKKEVEIAREFVLMNKPNVSIERTCPICGKEQGEFFYSKWGIDYLCCTDCRSIYANVDIETAEKYQESEDLLCLRRDDSYQEDANLGREEMWRDLIEWMEMRVFRFIHQNRNLSIVDFGNRYMGFISLIKQSEMCEQYDLRESIIRADEKTITDGSADLVLYFDQMQKETNPVERVQKIYDTLNVGGLLILGTRAGSGFDILTLKEHNEKIFPYEHITLPSVKGLTALLQRNGFKVLEITTPGVMDVRYVTESLDRLDDREGFVKYLLEESDKGILQEFQRFLQKGCLSSFVRVVAQKI